MKIARTLPVFTLAVVTCAWFAIRVAGSAIPMWEFLSRDEKMSHLYRVFSKQVARYCADSSRPDCNKNLLVAGIRNLAGMDDNLLDKLDPYQRGAKGMIWHAMTIRNGIAARVGHEAEEFYLTTDADLLATRDGETNGLTDDSAASSSSSSASSNDYGRRPAHTGPYLVGPMVIRVYPDGRPVPEDSTRPLPRDEDAEELRYSRLPSVDEIEANLGDVVSVAYRGAVDEFRAKQRPFYVIDKDRRRRAQATASSSSITPYPRRVLRRIAMDDRAIGYH